MDLLKFCLLASLYSLLAGCNYTGVTGDPVIRNLTWFSYLNGDDIRSSCSPGAPDRYRLIYNAQWDKQVRTYEITARHPLASIPTQTGAVLDIRVFVSTGVINSYIDTLSGRAGGSATSLTLGPVEIAEFRDKLARSGFDQPLLNSVWLRSDQFFWIGMACENGQFRYKAWPIDPTVPANDLARLAFPAFLMAHDTVKPPASPAHYLALSPFDSARAQKEHNSIQFRLEVDASGIRK